LRGTRGARSATGSSRPGCGDGQCHESDYFHTKTILGFDGTTLSGCRKGGASVRPGEAREEAAGVIASLSKWGGQSADNRGREKPSGGDNRAGAPDRSPAEAPAWPNVHRETLRHCRAAPRARQEGAVPAVQPSVLAGNSSPDRREAAEPVYPIEGKHRAVRLHLPPRDWLATGASKETHWVMRRGPPDTELQARDQRPPYDFSSAATAATWCAALRRTPLLWVGQLDPRPPAERDDALAIAKGLRAGREGKL